MFIKHPHKDEIINLNQFDLIHIEPGDDKVILFYKDRMSESATYYIGFENAEEASAWFKRLANRYCHV